MLALFFVAAPIVLAGELQGLDAEQRVRSSLLDAAAAAADRNAVLVRQRLDAVVAALSAAGVRPFPGRATPIIEAVERADIAEMTRQVEYLAALFGPASPIIRVAILDTEERVIATSTGVVGRPITGAYAAPMWTSWDGLVQIWPVFGFAGSDQRPQLGDSPFTSVRVDLMSSAGRRIGTIATRVDMLILADVITQAAPGREVYLIDGADELLMRSSKLALDPERFRSLADHSGTLSMGKVEAPDPISGRRSFIGVAPVPNTDWRVVVVDSTAPLDDLADAIVQQRSTRLVSVAFLLLAAYFIGRTAVQLRKRSRSLAAANLKLEAATEEKSRFLAAVSHDLRTPLNAILGFSDVLLQRMFGELNPKQEEYLRDIHGAGEHQLSLVNDLLDLSKIEAGKMELHPVPFSMRELIDGTIAIARPLADAKGVRLDGAVAPDVGTVEQDPARLKQVVLNLLSNAIKFTNAGGSVHAAVSVADGRVTIAVTDTGVGISAEDQALVFEEFRQVGASARSAQGTGLGLSLVRGFVRMMGGEVSLRSAVGKGSTFTVVIPLRQASSG